jgi:uncharacterized glyoxalase superfamily protein PhnB
MTAFLLVHGAFHGGWCWNGDYRPDTPAVLKIGDSIVMVSDAGTRRPSPAFLYVYVEDTDTTYQRAVEAGARALEAPSDLPYGDRRGMVEDNWGNTWQIATHRNDASLAVTGG